MISKMKSSVKSQLIKGIIDKKNQMNTLHYSNLKLKLMNQKLINQRKTNEDNNNQMIQCDNLSKNYNMKNNTEDNFCIIQEK